MSLNGTEIQLSFLLDSCLHWKKQWWIPQTYLSTWCTFLFIPLLYCKSGVSVDKERQENALSCLVVFFYTVYWAVTDILQLMGIINTLCSEKKGDAILSVINIHAAFQEKYMLCIYMLKHQVVQQCCWLWYVIAFSFWMFKPLIL